MDQEDGLPQVSRCQAMSQAMFASSSKLYKNFNVLLTVHLSIFISVINQFDAQNVYFTISLFRAFTCFEDHVFIIRRSKLYYTASGIITLKQVSRLKLLKYNSINMSK